MENYENQNSVELLLNEIDKSVEHKQYLIALFATLTIPDILGKVKYPNALGNKKRYVKWFDENIKDSFEAIIGIENTIKMDGTACFRLRNALLHGGDNVLGVNNDNNGVVCSDSKTNTWTITAGTGDNAGKFMLVSSDGTNDRYLTYASGNFRCYKTYGSTGDKYCTIYRLDA